MSARFSKSFCVLMTAGLCQAALSEASQHPLSIYGADSRQDLYQVTDPKVRQLADSTVALVQATQVDFSRSSSSAALSLGGYGDDLSLCTDERFFSQKTLAFCSGSLVGPDMVMTAGHCIKSMDDCNTTKLVFGFAMNSADSDVSQVDPSEVYGCSSIVARALEDSSADFALIKLDRKVVGHKPLLINRTGELAIGSKLILIGHPSGLPTKVADGHVLETSMPGYFSTTLDAFAGNSGSSVFNAETGKIEGILVRGENDFEFDGVRGCRVSSHYPEDGTRSEAVTKISALSQYIPNLVNIPENPTRCLKRETTIEITNVRVAGHMPTSTSDLSQTARYVLDELVRKLSLGMVPSTTRTQKIGDLQTELDLTSPLCQELRSHPESELYEANGGHWQKLTGAGILANSSNDLNGDLVPGYRSVKANKLYLIQSTFLLQ